MPRSARSSEFSKLTIIVLFLTSCTWCLHHRPLPHESQLPTISKEQIANPQTGPVIGVYSQELYEGLIEQFGAEYGEKRSIVYSNIVNYIRMSGARILPVSAFRNQSYYDELLPKINGVVFPGGAGYPDIRQVYTRNALYIFEFAKQLNEKGVYYPLWGTCLGMELFTYFTQGQNEEALSYVEGQMSTTKGVRVQPNSVIFRGVSQEVRKELEQSDKYLFFQHSKALLTSTLKKSASLSSFWEAEAFTKTDSGQQFVSAMRAKNYPFFAIIFHPQKTVYQWQGQKFPHYILSIRVAQELSLMFVEETRKSPGRFSNAREIQEHSIDACESYPHWYHELYYLVEEPGPVDRSKVTEVFQDQ